MSDAGNMPLIIDGVAGTARVSESIAGPVRSGMVIILLFFGIFGAWAAFSPLDGAIIGEGVVTVEGNRKSVEHLEGGTVKEVDVKEGQHVVVGDVLIKLDDDRIETQVDIYAQQYAVARATEARLKAELAGAAGIEFPPDLLADPSAYAKDAVAQQQTTFEVRRTSLQGAQQVLMHRIADLQEQIAGKRERQTSLEAQRQSIDAEIDSLKGLLDSGLTTRARSLDLQRARASLAADMSDNLAAIASAKENIAGDEQQIAQLANDQRSQVASDLADIQSKILDLGPSLDNARTSLARAVVRSPYEGRVVGLKVFSTGAVVAPGGTILDIVPDKTDLVVQTRVRVEDISDLKLGADAEVHFASYKRLYVPMMRATVTTISADRLTDDRTGVAYYLAQVVVDPADVARSKDISLYPGMSAQVMITTRKRSALEYLLGPLVASFDMAFRQE